CVSGAASVGAGVGPQFLTDIVGVAKAFTSRVGTGPFPTEVDGATAEHLRERGGGEYGTTTRRPRRVGWLDLVMLRMAVRVNGLVSLAVTKLDVLGGLDRIPVCVSYRVDGKTLKEFPASMRTLSRCEPVYREFKGWPDLSGPAWIATARKGRRALPEAVRKYLGFIEAQLKVPVRIISVGRPRAATIGHCIISRSTRARGPSPTGQSVPGVRTLCKPHSRSARRTARMRSASRADTSPGGAVASGRIRAISHGACRGCPPRGDGRCLGNDRVGRAPHTGTSHRGIRSPVGGHTDRPPSPESSGGVGSAARARAGASREVPSARASRCPRARCSSGSTGPCRRGS